MYLIFISVRNHIHIHIHISLIVLIIFPIWVLSYFLFISVRYHFQPIICFITPSATFPPLLQDYPTNVNYNIILNPSVVAQNVYLSVFAHICIFACFASYLNFKSLFPTNFNLKMAPNSETDIATLCFLVFIGRGLHTATIIQQIRPKLQHMQRISFGFTSREELE